MADIVVTRETFSLQEDGTVDMYVVQNDTVEATVIYKDSDGEIIPLTGYSAEFKVWDYRNDLRLSLTDGDGLTIEPGGAVDLLITDEQSEALPQFEGSYKFRVTPPDGGARVLMRGKFTTSD